MAPNEKSILLPVNIVSPTDIARLTREIEQIDNYFREQQIRQAGEPNALPRLSKLMDQLAADNQLNLLDKTDRGNIVQLLESLHESAPVMHISFSVDPPGAYVQKIVTWLRQNIHQHTLVTVGLQPNIGAGCVVRTTNRLFDFSLREFFSQKREFFVDRLHAAIAEPSDVMSDGRPADAAPVEQSVEIEVAPAPEPPATAEQSPVEAAEPAPVEQTVPEPAPVQPVSVVETAPESVTPAPIPAPEPLTVAESADSGDTAPKVIPISVEEAPKPLPPEEAT